RVQQIAHDEPPLALRMRPRARGRAPSPGGRAGVETGLYGERTQERARNERKFFGRGKISGGPGGGPFCPSDWTNRKVRSMVPLAWFYLGVVPYGLARRWACSARASACPGSCSRARRTLARAARRSWRAW